MKIWPPIQITEMDRVHRTAVEGKTRQVLVKFATYRSRARVFWARSILKPGGRRVTQPGPGPGSRGQHCTHSRRCSRCSQSWEPEGPGPTGRPGRQEDQAQQEAAPPPETRLQVYINDDLTKLRATLLYKARILKKDNKIKRCWTSDDRILILNHAGRVITIHNEDERNQHVRTLLTP